jgi:hypothetical protein
MLPAAITCCLCQLSPQIGSKSQVKSSLFNLSFRPLRIIPSLFLCHLPCSLACIGTFVWSCTFLNSISSWYLFSQRSSFLGTSLETKSLNLHTKPTYFRSCIQSSLVSINVQVWCCLFTHSLSFGSSSYPDGTPHCPCSSLNAFSRWNISFHCLSSFSFFASAPHKKPMLSN